MIRILLPTHPTNTGLPYLSRLFLSQNNFSRYRLFCLSRSCFSNICISHIFRFQRFPFYPKLLYILKRCSYVQKAHMAPDYRIYLSFVVSLYDDRGSDWEKSGKFVRRWGGSVLRFASFFLSELRSWSSEYITLKSLKHKPITFF